MMGNQISEPYQSKTEVHAKRPWFINNTPQSHVELEAKVNVLKVVVLTIGQDIAYIKARKAEISDISKSHLDTWNID